MTKLQEFLKDKANNDMVSVSKELIGLHMGRAYLLGKVEAYMEDGYSGLEIAEKLGIAESSARSLMNQVSKINEQN